MLDFAKLAAETTIASEPEFPSAAVARRRAADPALVSLVQEAAKDHKRRELPGSFSTRPYEGRKGASEYGTVVNELHRAAREVGVKVTIRRFDSTEDAARLTFRVAEASK